MPSASSYWSLQILHFMCQTAYWCDLCQTSLFIFVWSHFLNCILPWHLPNLCIHSGLYSTNCSICSFGFQPPFLGLPSLEAMLDYVPVATFIYSLFIGLRTMAFVSSPQGSLPALLQYVHALCPPVTFRSCLPTCEGSSVEDCLCSIW